MDCVWEEIESIEFLDFDDYNKNLSENDKSEFVYDFSVEDVETFTTAEGIVVHNTLNTFHSCGISSKSSMNQGISRIRELISISKNIKTPSLTIYLDKDNNNKESAKKLFNDIEAVYFDQFIDNSEIWYDPDVLNSNIESDKDFMKEYYEFFDDDAIDLITGNKTLSPWVLRIEINPLILINKNLCMHDIYFLLLKKFEKKLKLHIIYNDENSESIVFHFRFMHVDINECEPNSNVPVTNNDFELLQKLEEDLTSDLLLKGIKNIKKVTMREIKSKNMYGDIESDIVLDTVGSNLKDILQEKNIIDTNRTFSNNIHEIYETLGVEAAREALKREFYEVLDTSGVYVNDTHVNLLVDNMTLNGGLIAVNRYGISKADNGVMSMASFEEPHEHFMRASLNTSLDNMTSLTSNIIMGQVGDFGSGTCNLKPDIQKLIKFGKETTEMSLKNNVDERVTLLSKHLIGGNKNRNNKNKNKKVVKKKKDKTPKIVINKPTSPKIYKPAPVYEKDNLNEEIDF